MYTLCPTWKSGPADFQIINVLGTTSIRSCPIARNFEQCSNRILLKSQNHGVDSSSRTKAGSSIMKNSRLCRIPALDTAMDRRK